MLSRNKLKTFFSSLFAIGALALTSCDFGFNENSFQNKAAAYFKEMTSTAAISVYQIAPDDYVNNSAGVPCLPCTGDHTVTFILRNPQKYTFDKGSNMDLGLGDFAEYWGVEIVQDPSDTSKITVTYSEQFLREYGMGTDVSPKVTLYHPVSHSNFGLYDKLAISSDNPPPTPSGAVCMQSDENPSKWVLCFDLPKTPLIKALHQDISSIDINGHTFGVSVDAGGNISYAGGSELSTARPSGLYANQNTGQSFTSAGQAAYFVTGDKADETEKVYQITVTDKAGLSSSLNVSARGFKLGAPKAYQTDDSSYANPFMTVLATKNAVGQEEDGSAHITIHAEAMTASVSFTDKSGAEKTITPEPYDPSDAYILYEVYTEYDSSTNEFSNLVGSGKIKGLTGKVTIPGGTSYVRAYVQKPLYSDSDAIVWNCRAVCTNYFVSAIGGDDNAAGSKAAPLATIAKAVQKFEDGITSNDYEGTSGAILSVQVMSDLVQSESVTWSHGEADAPILKINGYGGKRKVDYANSGNAVHITDGRVYANNITFARCSGSAIVVDGGLSTPGFECDSCAFEDCHSAEKGGAIFNKDGVIVVSNSSFLRCHTDPDSGEGGAIDIVGDASAKITGCTFKGCSASRGAAIYSEKALLIYSSTISGNTTAAADSGAVHYAGDPGQFTIGGANNYILENPNTEAGKDRNVYLPLNHYICVDGLLTGSQIGVYMPFTSEVKPTSGTPKTFTQQYPYYNSETKPGVYFKTDTSYNIAEASGEAAFAVGGGAMVDALNYNVTFAGDAVPSAIYPGMTQVFKIIPTYKQKSPAKDLFLNPADKKLYGAYVSGAGYTGLVGGGKSVEFKAELYCGSTYLRDLDLEVAGHGDDQRICVTVSEVTNIDNYSVKVIANYLGVKYTSSYAFGCNKKAETVAAVIASLSNPATVTEYTFVVDGGVGSGYEMEGENPVPSDTEDNGLMLVADAIRTHGDGTVPLDNVRISLDASAATKASHLKSYVAPYFKNCAALQSIVLPDWIEYILPSLFENCANLTSVTLSANTQVIMQDGFKGCESLASITLPTGITGASDDDDLHGIREGAFDGCSHLANVYYEGTKNQWLSVARPASPTTWHSGVPSATRVHCSDGVECGLDDELASAPYTTLPGGTSGSVTGGTYVTFGLWPQTIKASGVTVNESDTEPHGAFTYCKGSDGAWYVKQAENAYNSGYSYSNGITVGQGGTSYQWFKVEPIKWRVLTDDYSGKKLLLAESILASGVPYYINEEERTIGGNTVYSSNYKYSTVRAYLNGSYETDDPQAKTYSGTGFLQSAFTSAQIAAMPTMTIDNSASSTAYPGTTYFCNNTNDKVFLLSHSEMTNRYGFGDWYSNGLTADTARQRTATDFALAAGASYEYDGYIGTTGCEWWDRSPQSAIKVQIVAANGSHGWESDPNGIDKGVVPALCVNP